MPAMKCRVKHFKSNLVFSCLTLLILGWKTLRYKKLERSYPGLYSHCVKARPRALGSQTMALRHPVFLLLSLFPNNIGCVCVFTYLAKTHYGILIKNT